MIQTSNYLIYKARDDSGFVVYNTFTGETKFLASADELDALTSSASKVIFTP